LRFTSLRPSCDCLTAAASKEADKVLKTALERAKREGDEALALARRKADEALHAALSSAQRNFDAALLSARSEAEKEELGEAMDQASGAGIYIGDAMAIYSYTPSFEQVNWHTFWLLKEEVETLKAQLAAAEAKATAAEPRSW
jgi:vacuolar-type H+-ATPase subunit H